jgi:hypothetical protein
MGMVEEYKNIAKGAGVVGGILTIGAVSKVPDSGNWMHDISQGIYNVMDFGLDILAGASIVGASCGVAYGLFKYVQFTNSSPVVAYRLSPPDGETDMERVQKMVIGFSQIGRKSIAALKNGRVWFTWRIQKDQHGKISFYVLVPKDVADVNTIQVLLKQGFPQAVVELDQSYNGIPFYSATKGTAGHMTLVTKNDAYGLKSNLENNIGDILEHMTNSSVLDIRFSRAGKKELQEAGRGMVYQLKSKEDKSLEDTRKQKNIVDRYMEKSAFDVSIMLWSKRTITTLGNALSQHTQGLNSLTLKEYGIFSKLRNPHNYSINSPLPHRRILMNDHELAQFLTLPDGSHPIMDNIDVILPKKKPNPSDFTQGFRIAWADHPELENRAIRVTEKQMILHPVISGASGSGKGGTLLTLMDDFLEHWCKNPNAPGFTLCDPHEVAALGIINRLLELEKKGIEVPWDRVRCFNLGKTDYPTPINLLAKYEGASIDEIVQETAELIVNAFPGELSKSRVMLENALHALLWDNETRTIGEISKLFKSGKHNAFRSALLAKMNNVMVRQWWEDEVIAKGDAGPKFDTLATRLNPFLSSQMMQRSYGQGKNVFDAGTILKEGHLVLVNFKGALEPAYKLTAGYIANTYHRAAQNRGIGGRAHWLAFDEAQLFRVPRFLDIVREDRKFGLGLMTITQDIEKLDKDFTEVLSRNSGLIVSMNQSDGAKKMTNLMRGSFSESVLAKLPVLHGALWSDGGSCNVKVDPPGFYLDGKLTAEKSNQEKEAQTTAAAKFLEISKRECPHFKVVDSEITERITGKKQSKGNLRLVAGEEASVVLPDEVNQVQTETAATVEAPTTAADPIADFWGKKPPSE